jgi:hypothetical protein
MPKYNNVTNIPAKIFFDILESKDFSLLNPKKDEKGLDEVFSSIYDDFFIRSDNESSKRYLELLQQTEFTKYKIQSIRQVLSFLFLNKTTKEIRQDLLEALIAIGVNINLENNFLDETKNILQVELGILENDLSFLIIELENMQKQNKDSVFNFYESLISLENIHERTLDDEMVLIKYIEYEKLGIKKSKAISQRVAKNKY